MRALGLASCLVVAGCLGQVPYVPVSSLTHPTPAQYPDHDAVFLLRDHRYTAIAPERLGATWIETRHDIIAVLTEAGFKYATLRIDVPDKGRVLELRARTILPSGEVRDLKPEEVFEGSGHADAARKKEKHRQKVMRLPGVTVGTLIEYIYRVEHEQMFWFAYERISEELPIRHYHAEILTSANIESRTVVYNSEASFKSDSGLDGVRATLDLTDLPAVRDEPMAPPWELDQPWWGYRSTSVTYGYTTHALYANWADVMRYVSEELEGDKRKLFAGADLSVPGAPACGQDRRCLLERALDRTREAATLTSFDSKLDDVRPLKDVLASKHADNFEKAILLRGLLGQLGVAARYAVVARKLGITPDPKFPLPNRFDHLVIEVMEQPGFDKPIVVDPSCEGCTVGEIPSWIEDRPVTALYDLRRADGKMSINLRELHGDRVLANETRGEIVATLSTAGALDARVKITQSGSAAVDDQIAHRGWTRDRWTKHLERAAQRHDKTARLGEIVPERCDRKQARCEVSYGFSVPSYATADHGELVVPLSFLAWPSPKRADRARTREVFIGRAHRQIDTYRLRVPAGWTVGALPSPAAWHGEVADISVEISRNAGEIVIVQTSTVRRGRWDKPAYADLEAASRGLAAIARQSFTLTPPK